MNSADFRSGDNIWFLASHHWRSAWRILYKRITSYRILIHRRNDVSYFSDGEILNVYTGIGKHGCHNTFMYDVHCKAYIVRRTLYDVHCTAYIVRHGPKYSNTDHFGTNHEYRIYCPRLILLQMIVFEDELGARYVRMIDHRYSQLPLFFFNIPGDTWSRTRAYAPSVCSTPRLGVRIARARQCASTRRTRTCALRLAHSPSLHRA